MMDDALAAFSRSLDEPERAGGNGSQGELENWQRYQFKWGSKDNEAGNNRGCLRNKKMIKQLEPVPRKKNLLQGKCQRRRAGPKRI